MESKICRACGKEKTLKNFDREKVVEGKIKYRARCKLCIQQGKLIPKSQFGSKKPKYILDKDFKLSGSVSKEDYIETYEFLKKIGYDIFGDIHAQFCKKYNLTYRRKTRRTQPQYLADGSINLESPTNIKKKYTNK